jgi:hypothetical protein
MSIKTIKHYIQVEGLKKSSRKNNIYNVLISSPVEIKDVDVTEVKVAGVKNKENNVTINGRLEVGIVMKKYIEYNGVLYEGLVDYTNNQSLPISEEDYIHKTKEMPGNYYEQVNVKDNIDIDTITLNPDFTFAEMEDFKNIIKTNEGYCLRKINKLLNDVICLNGDIYVKSRGPLFIYYDFGSSYNHRIAETNFLPSYFLHPFLDHQNKNSKYQSFYDLLPFNLLHGFDCKLDNSYENVCHFKECYQYYDVDILQKTNADIIGKHLFETTIGNTLSLILLFHHKKTYKSIPELQRNNFLQKIYQSYDFGKDIESHIKSCEESNYDLNVVMAMLDFLETKIKYFSNTSNRINTEKNNIRKIYDSDKNIFRDILSSYDRNYLLNVINKPSDEKCNLLLNGEGKTFLMKRDYHFDLTKKHIMK